LNVERDRVSIERIFYCDGRDCERHVQTAGSSALPFLTVTEDTDRELHFCGWDCLLRHAAEKPPAEMIPAGGG
jgi:hypothetical protein